jgi:hypothetical protein
LPGADQGEKKAAVHFWRHGGREKWRRVRRCATLAQYPAQFQAKSLARLGENFMGAFSGTPVNPGGPYREHREVPRFTLIASIELREPQTDTRISGRISEISRKGCYVDVLITLPEGTGLDVRISRDQGVFETKGKIVYVQHGMGMGVTFVNPAPEQLQLLDTWLAEISS